MSVAVWEIVQGLYLLLGLTHITVTSLGYIISLIYVLGQKPPRFIPCLVIILVTALISIFFWTVFGNLSIPDLFNDRRWPSDIFQHWPMFFFIDPALLIFVVWFKLACAVDATRFIPTRDEVERFRDEYEVVRGHRDFVVIYCLRGDESQEDTLASVRAAINSRFPAHRLRVLLLFYGESSSVFDRFLRTHLSPEPLDPSLDDAPIEHLVASNGVKISVLRINTPSSNKANLRCLEFLTMAYEDDKLRKPIVCFLSTNTILDEMAVARFVYELDDPHREFITGVQMKSDNEYVLNRLLSSVRFWLQIQSRITEDYCGNATQLSREFLVARFKALNAVASQAYVESESSELVSDHHLTMCFIKAKSTRHRIGICLGAIAKPASSAFRQPVMKEIKRCVTSLMDNFIHNAEIALEPHILSTCPMLSLLTIASSIFEPHIYFFIQLLLLEHISGRGSALGSSYIFLLLLPSSLFLTFTAYKNGETLAVISIFVNFLFKLIIDIIADVAICVMFVQEHIWKRFIRRYSKIGAGSNELTSVQKIV